MKYKKSLCAILFFILLGFSNLFATGFEEHILTPKFGFFACIPTSSLDDPKNTEHWPLGPSIDFDAKFNHKSGFSFMTTANIWVTVDLNAKPPAIPVAGLLLTNVLFGYTHGVSQNFEFTIATGVGLAVPFLVPTIPLHFDFSYFFNEKYGITVTLINHFGIMPKPVALIDFAQLSIGASFRL